MTTKLEIIGPYTPEHEGPFCTRDGESVRIICTDCSGRWPIVGLIMDDVGASEAVRTYCHEGRYLLNGSISGCDLMNAREVRVPREVWVTEENASIGRIKEPEEFTFNFPGNGQIVFHENGSVSCNIKDMDDAASKFVMFVESHFRSHIIRAEARVRAEIARDSERLDWIAAQFKTTTVYISGDALYAPSRLLYNLKGQDFRAAIDAAREVG